MIWILNGLWLTFWLLVWLYGRDAVHGYIPSRDDKPTLAPMEIEAYMRYSEWSTFREDVQWGMHVRLNPQHDWFHVYPHDLQTITTTVRSFLDSLPVLATSEDRAKCIN